MAKSKRTVKKHIYVLQVQRRCWEGEGRPTKARQPTGRDRTVLAARQHRRPRSAGARQRVHERRCCRNQWRPQHQPPSGSARKRQRWQAEAYHCAVRSTGYADGFLRSKKKLKGHAAYNGVFLSEQLSPMRAKLLHAVKNDADTARTWTIDGKIFCTKGADPDGKRYVLTSPDDLFKQFGWGEDKLKKSGLFVD